MSIDKLRDLIHSDFDWKKILIYTLPIVSFLIGLIVPSPLYGRLKEAVGDEELQLVEETYNIGENMAVYSRTLLVLILFVYSVGTKLKEKRLIITTSCNKNEENYTPPHQHQLKIVQMT